MCLFFSLFLAPTNVLKRQVNSTFCSAVLCLWACFCGVFMLPIIWLYSNVLCLLWERVLHCTHKSESKMKSNSNNNTVDIIKETEEKQQKKTKTDTHKRFEHIAYDIGLMCISREWNTHYFGVYELKWKLNFVYCCGCKWIFTMVTDGPFSSEKNVLKIWTNCCI